MYQNLKSKKRKGAKPIESDTSTIRRSPIRSAIAVFDLGEMDMPDRLLGFMESDIDYGEMREICGTSYQL